VNTPLRRSGMARVLQGSHSFTCTPSVHPQRNEPYTCLCLPSRSWYSFTDPGRMEGWVGLWKVAKWITGRKSHAYRNIAVQLRLFITSFNFWFLLNILYEAANAPLSWHGIDHTQASKLSWYFRKYQYIENIKISYLYDSFDTFKNNSPVYEIMTPK